MKLPLEATYRVGVGFIEMKYYEINAEDVARILFNEFKKQHKAEEMWDLQLNEFIGKLNKVKGSGKQ